MTETSSVPTPSDAAAPNGPITSMEQLSAARQQRGLSVSDVAAKLGMVPRQIEALERSDWNALPGQAFVRGAIRAYGKALQIDIDPLLTAVGGHVPAAELRPSASLEAPLPKHGALGFANGGSGSKLVWILLGVIGVVAIALYFGRSADFGGTDEAGTGTSSRAVDAVPLPGADGTAGSGGTAGGAAGSGSAARGSSSAGSPAPGQPAASSTAPPGAGAGAASGMSGAPGAPATSGTPGAASAGAAPAAGTAGGTSTATGPQPLVPAAAAPSAAAAPDALRFTFERESWVEVRDAAGSVLLYGTQPAQSTREVQGKRPYTLVVGNAGYVRLERGGQPIDLKAPTRQGVARLTVD
ncbi:MAG: helix-turn-helix domain-containing protein [Burkholderiaceae bacterium]